MKFCCGEAKLFLWMDRQTDMMKLIINFCNFAKAPKWENLRDNPKYVVHPVDGKLEDVMGILWNS